MSIIFGDELSSEMTLIATSLLFFLHLPLYTFANAPYGEYHIRSTTRPMMPINSYSLASVGQTSVSSMVGPMR